MKRGDSTHRSSSRVSPTIRASFELLGVEPTSSQSEIKKAYHRVALLYHPDRNPNPTAAVEFSKITEAYELLCDPVRLSELNRKHHHERLYRQVVDGIEITYGAFFGYRLFDPARRLHDPSLQTRLLTGQSSAADSDASELDLKVKTKAKTKEKDWLPIEENNSILDHASYDALEVVYAGRLSNRDEAELKRDLNGDRLVQLPWVVLNNQGLLCFLNRDLRGARRAYQELCERVPNNIVFEYRLAICLILEAFKKPTRTLFGGFKPDAKKIEQGIQLLEHAIRIGEERPVGRQKCLVIKKLLADVLEKTGRARQAKKQWRRVFADDPNSVEAVYRVKGDKEATKLFLSKQNAKSLRSDQSMLRITGKS